MPLKTMAVIAVFLTLGALEATTPRVRVVHEAADTRLARSLASRAQKALARLEARFSLAPKARVLIILTSSAQDYQKAQPGERRVPAWSAGTAYPELNLIVLKSWRAVPGLDVDRVLNHELAHLVLGRFFGRREVPAWLNEGLTMHLAGDWSLSRQVAMARALASDRLIPLGRLVRGFPLGPVDAETAYAQSYYFLAFLRDRYGREVLERLVQNLGLGVSPENALLQISGLRQDELEDEFSEWLKKRFSFFWILTGPGTVWVLAVVLLIVGVLFRRRAAARKIAEWEAEEDGTKTDSGRSRGPCRKTGPEGQV